MTSTLRPRPFLTDECKRLQWWMAQAVNPRSHKMRVHKFTPAEAKTALKEVGHTFVVMVCILPIFNSLRHHLGIVIFDA